MEIRERIVDGIVILDLEGRLILSDGEKDFRDKVDDLMARGQNSIIVNFEQVDYLDSAGVGVVVWKYVTLRRRGGSLKLLNLKARSHRVLAITKLLTVMESFDREADALASFSRV